MSNRGSVLGCLASSLLFACGGQQGPGASLAQDLEDRDRDGWFSAATNAAVTLTLVSGTFPAPGGYEILVDEVRFPTSPTLNGSFQVGPHQVFGTMALGGAVATRVRGVDGLGAAGTPFGANVRVVHHPPLFPAVDVGGVRVAFGETNGALSPVVIPWGPSSITLNFSVATTRFADPNPDSATGDSDLDGIGENIESRLTAVFGGTFDPRAGSLRDIDLIIGSVDPAFALTARAREDLRSRFFQNGFSLHLDAGEPNAGPVAGGVMDLTGTGATASGAVTPAQALAVRNLNVGPTRRATAYFMLLAAAALDSSTGKQPFGVTIRGAMVMRAGFLGINDIAWYQAGLVMHELGHGLGLCHPISQDGATSGTSGGSLCGVCGAIPVVQRDNGASVMGAPADDPNVAQAAINTLRRPLDYTAGQWSLVTPGCSFTP
jgi:hypothetical protein